jgi:hypothetical protein
MGLGCKKCGFVNESSCASDNDGCPQCGAIYSKATGPRVSPAPPALTPERAIDAKSRPASPTWTNHWFWMSVVPAIIFIGAGIVGWLGGGDTRFGGGRTAASAETVKNLCVGWFIVLSLIFIARKIAGVQAERLAAFEAVFASDGYSVAKAFVGVDKKRAIVIDPNKNAATLYEFSSPSVQRRVIPFSDLLSVDLYEDSELIMATGKGSPVVRLASLTCGFQSRTCETHFGTSASSTV